MGLTRSAALRRAGLATAGVVTGSALARISLERAEGAYAAPPLEHYYTTPFRPGVSFAVPGSWQVVPDFLPDVREPRHVGISNRPITITKTFAACHRMLLFWWRSSTGERRSMSWMVPSDRHRDCALATSDMALRTTPRASGGGTSPGTPTTRAPSRFTCSSGRTPLPTGMPLKES
jgi:hypothetical protein